MGDKFCTSCGVPTRGSQNFCGGCGAKIEPLIDTPSADSVVSNQASDNVHDSFLCDLISATTKYKGNKKFHCSVIPEKILANAFELLNIPKEETVFAFLDESIFTSSGARGVALGTCGIYWRNDFLRPHNISWADLLRCQSDIRSTIISVYISIDDSIDIGQCGVPPKDFEKLLKECISIYEKYIDDNENDALIPSWYVAWNKEQYERGVNLDFPSRLHKNFMELRAKTELKLDADSDAVDSDSVTAVEKKPRTNESTLGVAWYILWWNLIFWISNIKYGKNYSTLDDSQKKSIRKAGFFSTVFLALIFVFILIMGSNRDSILEAYSSHTSAENTISFTGEWYDDVESPTFLDARLIITTNNGVYILRRINGDNSSAVFSMTKKGNRLYKDGDKFGAYYVPTASGLEIHDSKGYIRTAFKVR